MHAKFISALKKEKLRRDALLKENDWNKIARPEQKLPKGDWFGWLILAGRGFGKTRTGAESIKQLVELYNYKRIALIGETYDEIRDIMIEGESGILSVYDHLPKEQQPMYLKSKKQLIWANGAIANFYSAEHYKALRGPQFDLAWIDEFAKFDNAQEVWDQLSFCLRLGNPKVIITTTPKPTDIIFKLSNRSDIFLTRGTTFDNRYNLSKNFLKLMETEYENTQIGAQEIYGQLVANDEGQIWNIESFIYQEISNNLINKMEIIIAIDPAITANSKSNETGIIVAGKLQNHYYILEDASGKMNFNCWMHKAIELNKKYNAQKIIVETNQGGDMLLEMLKNGNSANWIGVRAKKNKYSRAFPIASLYEQKKVTHRQKFIKLEEQLLKAHTNFADDRLDALTWALSYLTKINIEKTFSPNLPVFQFWT